MVAAVVPGHGRHCEYRAVCISRFGDRPYPYLSERPNPFEFHCSRIKEPAQL